ncbi:hypothetical protein BsWGS_27730 [Bradybaena similaris]
MVVGGRIIEERTGAYHVSTSSMRMEIQAATGALQWRDGTTDKLIFVDPAVLAMYLPFSCSTETICRPQLSPSAPDFVTNLRCYI